MKIVVRIWLLLILLCPWPALACPFCNPSEGDLFTDIESAQAAAVVSVVAAGKYKIEEALIGELRQGRVVLGPRLPGHSVPQGSSVLLLTLGSASQPYWSGPVRMLNGEEVKFARRSCELVKAEPARQWDLATEYLEHDSDLLAKAAYAVLATAPLNEVQKRAKQLGSQRMSQLIRDPKIPEQRRSLYLMMALPQLTSKDGDWLGDQIKKPLLNPFSPILPPLMIAYMEARGPKGVLELEALYLKPKTTPAASFGVSGAFAFVGANTRSSQLRESVVELFRRELDHPERGVFAIVPLAVWGDYSVADRVEKIAAEKANVPWAKRSVVRYFRSFDTPQAAQALQRLAKSDPELVRDTTVGFGEADLGF